MSSSSPTSLEKPASPDPADRAVKRAAAVWAGLGQIYGRRFQTEFGESPSPYWVREIAELSTGQLQRGMTRLRREAREFPPNLSQFVDACTRDDARPNLGADGSAFVPLIETPPRPDLGLPGGMSPICYQRASDIAKGRWPYLGGMYISPGSLAPGHWAEYQRGEYPNADEHRAYCVEHPEEYAGWMDYRRQHWGNRYGFGPDGRTKLGAAA